MRLNFVVVGGALGGVLGIFLSIPAVAALRILWLNWTHQGFARKAA
jgi:predicted PurR-regulated permease PerM